MVRPRGRQTPEKNFSGPRSTVRTIWSGNCRVPGSKMWPGRRGPLAWSEHSSSALWPPCPWGGSWPGGALGLFPTSKDSADLSAGKDTSPSHPFVQKWAMSPALCYWRSSLWVHHGPHKASLLSFLLLLLPAHSRPCQEDRAPIPNTTVQQDPGPFPVGH